MAFKISGLKDLEVLHIEYAYKWNKLGIWE